MSSAKKLGVGVTQYLKCQIEKTRISEVLVVTKSSLATVFLLMLCIVTAVAQVNQSTKSSPPRPPDMTADKSSPDNAGPMTTFEEEMRAKRAIKLAEKEHQENLNRAKEICQLGQDLKSELQSRLALDRDDSKKLERLEKLTKKIRGEAGGEDDDVQIANAPADVSSAITQIADNAEQLSKDVQKTPRQVVSAAVIDRANVLLQLVKILRGFIH